jgi:hypothetical protein
MLRKLTIAALLATLFPFAANAQSMCTDRTDILKALGTKYSEAPVGMGLAANGTVLEVLASKEGTWTIIFTRPNGVSCVLAAGQSWESIEKTASLDPKA